MHILFEVILNAVGNMFSFKRRISIAFNLIKLKENFILQAALKILQ